MGIDGVVLYANTTLDCWPILFRVVGHNDVYTYGVYAGKGKPKSSNELLSQYVKEFEQIKTSGFHHNGRNYAIKSRAYIMDSPAKALVLEIKYPRGFSSCPRCKIRGFQKDNRMVFLSTTEDRRSDSEFRLRMDLNHHRTLAHLALEDLSDLNMVQDIACESMHNSFLGVSKLLLKLLIEIRGKSYSLSKTQIAALNSNISNLKWPKEFNRHLRPLDCFHIYKATELKNWLFYVGMVILKDVLDQKHLDHFMKLSIGIRILWDEKDCLRNNKTAHQLIREFIDEFPHLYSEIFVGFNVHSLIHLPEDVLYFRCGLSSLSAFKFESQNMVFKKMVKTGKNCLEQLGNRILEELSTSPESSSEKSTFEGVKFKQSKDGATIFLNGYEISHKIEDKYCLIEDSVFEVQQIFENSSDFFVSGCFIGKLEPWFHFPVNSLKLKIFSCTNNLIKSHPKTFNIDKIDGKFFRFEIQEKNVFVKMLHT